MAERRELYRSPDGKSWYLGREPTDGRLSSFISLVAHLEDDCPISNWVSFCAPEMARRNRHCCD